MIERSSRKQLAARWFEEAYTRGQTELADHLFAPQARFNGQAEGPAGPKGRVRAYRLAFPDIRANIQTMLEDKDFVFIRWIAEGTHKGPFNGIPATGKVMKTMIFVQWKFEGEQVVEDWTVFDRLSALEQLGVVTGSG